MTIQREVARRLSAGSAEVARRLGRRAAGASLTAKVIGGVALVKGGPILLDAAHQQPLIMPAAAGAWCFAAWRADTQPQAPADTDDEQEVEQETEEEPDTGEFLALLHQLMPRPTDRVHLAQIAEHLTGDPRATGPVREMCAAAGVPITAVRVPGRGSSTGIYGHSLPRPSDPSRQPLPGVVAAGQSQQQQQQQHDAADGREGFVTLPDPDGNPHRTVVHWIKETS